MKFKEGDWVKLTSKRDGNFAILKILEVKDNDEYKYKVVKKLHPYSKYTDIGGNPIQRIRISAIDNFLVYDIKIITEDEAKVDML